MIINNTVAENSYTLHESTYNSTRAFVVLGDHNTAENLIAGYLNKIVQTKDKSFDVVVCNESVIDSDIQNLIECSLQKYDEINMVLCGDAVMNGLKISHPKVKSFVLYKPMLKDEHSLYNQVIPRLKKPCFLVAAVHGSKPEFLQYIDGHNFKIDNIFADINWISTAAPAIKHNIEKQKALVS